jgi:hypothetical protein
VKVYKQYELHCITNFRSISSDILEVRLLDNVIRILFSSETARNEFSHSCTLVHNVPVTCTYPWSVQQKVSERSMHSYIIHEVSATIPIDTICEESGAHQCKELRVKDGTNVRSIILHYAQPQHDTHTYILSRRYRLNEYIRPPTRCFRCQCFGHIAAKCRSAPRCVRCGESHDALECAATTRHCANCGQAHSAAWSGCPTFEKHREERRKRVGKSSIAPTKTPAPPSVWPSLPPTSVWADRVPAPDTNTHTTTPFELHTQDVLTHVSKSLSDLDAQMKELYSKVSALAQQVIDLAASLDEAVADSVHTIFDNAQYVSALKIHKDEHEEYTISDLLDRVSSLVTHHTEHLDRFDKITDTCNIHSDQIASMRTELTKLTRCFGPPKK